MPAALGRHVRLLEDDLGHAAFSCARRGTWRLTADGAMLVEDARGLIRAGERDRPALSCRQPTEGADLADRRPWDTASTGLVAAVVCIIFRAAPSRRDRPARRGQDRPACCPRLLVGGVSIWPSSGRPSIGARSSSSSLLFHETRRGRPRVRPPPGATQAGIDRRARRRTADRPPIVRSRPHSHDLTMKLFEKARIRPGHRAARRREADDRAAGGYRLRRGDCSALGVEDGGGGRSVTSHSTRKISTASTSFRWPVAWIRGTRDPLRDRLLQTLRGLIGPLSSGA